MPLFRKKGIQELNAWAPEMNMTGVSISESDKINGSPMVGDMIAVNKNDPTDIWLVAEKFFNDNYEPE